MEFILPTVDRTSVDGYPCRSRIEEEARKNLLDHYKIFWRFLRGRVRTADDADDVLQEFCLRVLRCSCQIQRPEAVGSWMAKVLRTTLIDYYRRGAAECGCEEHVAASMPPTGEPADEQCCPYLGRVLPTIKPEYAEMIRRIDFLDEPRGEVAESVGTSVNALTVRLFRARRAFRKKLVPFCEIACDRYGTTCGFSRPTGRLSEAGGTSGQDAAVGVV